MRLSSREPSGSNRAKNSLLDVVRVSTSEVDVRFFIRDVYSILRGSSEIVGDRLLDRGGVDTVLGFSIAFVLEERQQVRWK